MWEQWEPVIVWLVWSSGAMFVGSLVVVPIVLIKLPADYLVRDQSAAWPPRRHPVLYVIWHIVKNILGLAFLLAGIVMLLTPGQGLLSILVGLFLLDLPGKRKIIHRIVARPRVLKTINAIRTKAGKEPLESESEEVRG